MLASRATIRGENADVRLPILYEPTALTEAESEVWRDERFNIELAHGEEVGSIAPISGLDALLFAHQAARFSQIERPTEFIASVLRRELAGMAELTVVFGAGSEMFPPRSAYGSETVDEYLAEGWTFWYHLHNHTVQRNGESLALGVPVPSTSDVQLVRSLGDEMGLQGVRVTNGFFTFSA